VGFRPRILYRPITIGLWLLNPRSYVHVVRKTWPPGSGHRPAGGKEYAGYPDVGRYEGATDHSNFLSSMWWEAPPQV
jgi:hypothetical protein